MCTVTITYNDNFDTIDALIDKIKAYGATVVNEKNPEYNPEFVAKIQRGMESYKKGEYEIVEVEDLWR